MGGTAKKGGAGAVRTTGEELSPKATEADQRRPGRVAGALGRLTCELHALDVVGGPNGWDEFWDECLENVVHRHAEEGVPAELAAEVGSFLDSIGKLACEPRVFLHTELMDQHVLVEERLGRYELCGLIDSADCRVGPAEYDLPAPVEFLFRGEEGLLRSFLVAYGFPSDELTPELSERMLRAVEPARPATLSELARLLYDVS